MLSAPWLQIVPYDNKILKLLYPGGQQMIIMIKPGSSTHLKKMARNSKPTTSINHFINRYLTYFCYSNLCNHLAWSVFSTNVFNYQFRSKFMVRCVKKKNFNTTNRRFFHIVDLDPEFQNCTF